MLVVLRHEYSLSTSAYVMQRSNVSVVMRGCRIYHRAVGGSTGPSGCGDWSEGGTLRGTHELTRQWEICWRNQHFVEGGQLLKTMHSS